ncbi:MAG: hypothetical protein ABSF43_00250 [Rectinemataceae bacterium]|jgi:hypothetical protein
MKPNRRFFQILLIILAAILIIYGFLRYKFGAFLPAAVDKNLPDVIMFSAVGIMLWNRKQRNDEKKAAAERKRLEEEAAAARYVDAEDTAAADTVAESATKKAEPLGEGDADAPG